MQSKIKKPFRCATKKYYEKNKEHIQEYKKQYSIKNKEEINEKARQYYKENSDKILKYSHDYYLKNKDKIAEYKKRWSEKNRENRRNYTREYTVERRKTDDNYRMKTNIRNLIYCSFYRVGRRKRESTEKIIGCTIENLEEHLKETFVKNYGYEWDGEQVHIDHIIPLSTAKTENDITLLCNWKNLQLLKPEDNLRKGARIL